MTHAHAHRGSGRRGIAKVAALGTLVAGALAVAAYVGLGGLGSTADAAGLAAEPGPSPVALEITLAASGLSPRALAAAGATAAQTAAALDAAKGAIASVQGGLPALEQSASAAARRVDRLEALARSGTATAQDLAELSSARAERVRAAQARDAALESVFAAAAAELPPEAAAVLRRVRGAHDLPVAHRAAERTEADAVRLRAALAQARIAGARGEAVPDDARRVIEPAEALPAATAARQRLLEGQAAVTQAWNTAVGR